MFVYASARDAIARCVDRQSAVVVPLQKNKKVEAVVAAAKFSLDTRAPAKSPRILRWSVRRRHP